VVERGMTVRGVQHIERQEIVDTLREEIASGLLKPGQRLTEIQLIERFELTRNKVRDALGRLQADRLLKVVPNVGAVVTELSQKDIEHSYDLMGALEGLAVRVSTPYILPQHLERLQLLIDKMEAADEPSAFLVSNDEFHILIASLSENDLLTGITGSLRFRLRRFGLQALQNPLQIAASRKEHRRIFEAIKGIKPTRAEQLVRDHYLYAKNRLIKGMNKSL
jgi:DNA-binding GntR family transcriptional regulator